MNTRKQLSAKMLLGGVMVSSYLSGVVLMFVLGNFGQGLSRVEWVVSFGLAFGLAMLASWLGRRLILALPELRMDAEE